MTKKTHHRITSEGQAQELAADLLKIDTPTRSVQEIIDQNLVPRLKGFTVVHGKVSDSIHGGHGSFPDKDGKTVEFENPPLTDANGTPIRILIRTEKISTHDIGRGTIPFKDQVLSMNHNFMRQLLSPFIAHAQIDAGLPNTAVVSFAKNLNRFPIENITRAYPAVTTTSTSIYQHYFEKGKKQYCGIDLSRYGSQLQLNKRLPFVMDTPSSKSMEHDESMAPEDLFEGIFDAEYYRAIRNDALIAFGVVAGYLWQKGMILVDTKTEHGIDSEGKILFMDELYTMDSSRFWKRNLDGSILMDNKTNEPISFSKEFARGMSKGTDGYTDDQRIIIAGRYMEGIHLLTGDPLFVDMTPWQDRVVSELHQGIAYLSL